MLAPEQEEAPEGKEGRPDDAAERGLAVALEQEIERKTRDHDFEDLDEREGERETPASQEEPQGDKSNVEGVEQPRLVARRGSPQAVLEVPCAQAAAPYPLDEVGVERDVHLVGIRPSVKIGEGGPSQQKAPVYGDGAYEENA